MLVVAVQPGPPGLERCVAWACPFPAEAAGPGGIGGPGTTDIMRSVARRPQDTHTNMPPMMPTQL